METLFKIKRAYAIIGSAIYKYLVVAAMIFVVAMVTTTGTESLIFLILAALSISWAVTGHHELSSFDYNNS